VHKITRNQKAVVLCHDHKIMLYKELFTTYQPTQLSVIIKTTKKLVPRCDDALWLGNKVKYGSYHMWIKYVKGR